MLYRSEITNLPGQQNCAKIQRNHEKFEQPPNKNLHYIQFQHNSIEAYPENVDEGFKKKKTSFRKR